MRGDRTAHILRSGGTDWQGDPTGEEVRLFIANDCAHIPTVNKDDGSLVAGEAQFVIFPGAENVPGPKDELEIEGLGVWQIEGDVAHFTKSGQTKAWMMNVRQQR